MSDDASRPPDELVGPGLFVAVIHMATPGLDGMGYQRCLRCGTILVDHSDKMLSSEGGRLGPEGQELMGFPAGMVTQVFPPPEAEMPTVTVPGAVKYARPCTISEAEWEKTLKAQLKKERIAKALQRMKPPAPLRLGRGGPKPPPKPSN